MKSPKPQESRNHRRFESVYRPRIVRAGVFCAGLVVLLQVIGIFSRNSGGYILIGLFAVLWLTLSIVRHLSDD